MRPNHKMVGFEEDVHTGWRRYIAVYLNHCSSKRNDKAFSRSITRAHGKEDLREEIRAYYDDGEKIF